MRDLKKVFFVLKKQTSCRIMVLSRKLHIDSSFSTRSEAEGFVQEASPVEGY